MATTVIPALLDALVTVATAVLPKATILDGYGVTEFVGDYLMIGVDDPYSPEEALAGSSQQDWAHANYTARNESGDITCVAVSWNGAESAKGARDSVFAITTAFEAGLRANPSLGLANLLWTSYGTNTQFSQGQDEDGAFAVVAFQIHFEARI
jgi:hypothetical protein